MNERRSDFELLRDFVRKGNQAAFAAVARHHLDLVYATALRKVEDGGAAEEIAQNVFTALARKAWQFGPDDSLPAWLHRTALFEAREWLRGELRRRRREQTAAELGTTMKTPDEQSALRALVPLLDDALLSLREKDRTALLLRFQEHLSMREVGVALGIGEDAAQKRVSSALDRLAAFFQRRGFKTASLAATTAILQSTATSAPAALAAGVTHAALLSPPVLPAVASLLSRLAGITKTQAGGCLALVLIPAVLQWNTLQETKQNVTRMEARLAAIRAESERVRSEIARVQPMTRAERDFALVRNQQAQQKLRELQKRLRELLASSNYRWPEDLPFVRVPRLAVDEIHMGVDAFDSNGRLKHWTVELLGLDAPERAFMESHLSEYLRKWTELARERMYKTNSTGLFMAPPDSWAAKTMVMVIPDLGIEGERLFTEHGHRIREMLGQKRANHWDSLWIEGHAASPSYPSIFTHGPNDSTRRFVFAFGPEGAEPREYFYAWDGNYSMVRKLPLDDRVPEFLHDHINAFIQSQTGSNPQTGERP